MSRLTADERLAVGLQECVGDLWGGEDFSDFNVVVEGTTYRCHRFILAAVSGFFQGLFRSNMKECQRNSVEIESIESDIFDVVITSIYCGRTGLTSHNCLDVWAASEQLQVAHLIDECQRFVIDNTNVLNCFKVFNYASSFGSQSVITSALDIITLNFNQLKSTIDILKLPFEDFNKIVANECLEVYREDSTLKTIIKWVEYSDTFNTSPFCDNMTKNKSDRMQEMTRIDRNDKASRDGSDKNSMKGSDADVLLLTSVSTTVQNKKCRNSIPPCRGKEYNKGSVKIPESSSSKLHEKSVSQIKGAESVLPTRKRCHAVLEMDENCVTEDGKNCHNLKISRDDRRVFLVELFQNCRLYLVSSTYLQKLLETNQMLISCPEPRQMLVRALVYTLNVGRRHDCWPEQAIHRMSSGCTHVMVYRSGDNVESYELTTGSRHVLGILGKASKLYLSRMCVYDNNLFCLYGNPKYPFVHGTKFTLGRFSKEEGFSKVLLNLDKDAKMLVHDKYLYLLTESDNQTSNLERYCKELGCGTVLQSCGAFHADADCLVRLNHHILVFHTSNDAVFAEDFNAETLTKKHIEESLSGKSKGMISFSYGGDIYLIQTNGSLWKITVSETDSIHFEPLAKLWDTKLTIYGSAIFKNKLHLFFNVRSMKGVIFLKNLPTSLPQIARIPMDIDTNMVPMVIPKEWLSSEIH